MEEEILDLLNDHIKLDGSYINYESKEIAAKETTKHVMKFAEWCTNNTVRLYNRDEKYLILETDIQVKTIEDLYQYWHDNVFNK